MLENLNILHVYSEMTAVKTKAHLQNNFHKWALHYFLWIFTSSH
jgi:hypothetical protein